MPCMVRNEGGEESMALLRQGSQHVPNVGKAGVLVRLGLALAGLVPALCMAPAVTFAQAVPAAAPPPGTIGLPTREELESGAPPTRAQPAAPSRLHVDDSVERAPCALDAPRYAAIRVRIGQANFANLGPVPASALDSSWKSYAGTDQPISVLCRIRDSAATSLRAAAQHETK